MQFRSSWGGEVMLQTRPAHVDLSSPLISVVMANYQAGPKIVRALDSVLGQSISNLEVIVSDDASGDDSIALVRQAMQADKRIRLIEAERNGGPARSRNRALEAARGQWIAIVDSDDIIHPERFERLLAAADYFHADVVADDLLHFHEDGAPIRFLLDDEQKYPFAVTPEAWVLAGVQPGTAPLGYLKPMIKASALGSLRYDETLRIGEDYDLLLRVLLSGREPPCHSRALVSLPPPQQFDFAPAIGERCRLDDRQSAAAERTRRPLPRTIAGRS